MLAPFISRTDPSLCISVGRRTSLVTWGHFHDCVAIRISWIRGWCIRTPWCCEEVSSLGQHGVNYVLSPPPLLMATNWRKVGVGGGWQKKCFQSKNAWTPHSNKFPHHAFRRTWTIEDCLPFKQETYRILFLPIKNFMGLRVAVGGMVSIAAIRHKGTSILALC